MRGKKPSTPRCSQPPVLARSCSGRWTWIMALPGSRTWGTIYTTGTYAKFRLRTCLLECKATVESGRGRDATRGAECVITVILGSAMSALVWRMGNHVLAQDGRRTGP